MPNQGGLQLLPETRKKISVSVPGENRPVYIGLVFLMISIIVVGGLYLYRSRLINQYNQTKDRVEELSRQLNSKENQEFVAQIEKTSQQLDLASGLLDSHVLWSKGLDRLEELLVPSVQLDNLSLNRDKKEVSFKAFAPSYTIIAKQVSSFVNSEYFTDLSIGEIKSGPDGRFEFGMIINFDDKFVLDDQNEETNEQ